MIPLRAAEIVDFPNLVAPLPYINFLRFFKRQHPRYGLPRLLQEAPAYWDSLSDAQKNLFQKQRILARTKRTSLAQRCKILKIRRFKVRKPIYNIKYPVGKRTRRKKRKVAK